MRGRWVKITKTQLTGSLFIGSYLITPKTAAVEAFARPLLAAFDAEIGALGKSGENLLKAMTFFEAIKQQGISYIKDSNTPYAERKADRAAVDHIQYPADVLQQKGGDCDDLTVLYCALLENNGVNTALVDYPGHIFMMFDTGIERLKMYQLPIEENLYVVRGNRLWIPVEITLLDQSFHQAWRAGIEEWGKLPQRDRRRKVVDTRKAWEQYPPANPPSEGDFTPPSREVLEEACTAQYETLRKMIDEFLDDSPALANRLNHEHCFSDETVLDDAGSDRTDIRWQSNRGWSSFAT